MNVSLRIRRKSARGRGELGKCSPEMDCFR